MLDFNWSMIWVSPLVIEVRSLWQALVTLLTALLMISLEQASCPQRPLSQESIGWTSEVSVALSPMNREMMPPVLRHWAAGPVAADWRADLHPDDID
jgi:hypothetical protein